MGDQRDLDVVAPGGLPAEIGDESPIMRILSNAVASGAGAEAVKALTETYLALKREDAKTQYVQAMIRFQQQRPKIVKDQDIEFATKRGGSFKSRFAPLESITKKLDPLILDCGFMYVFSSQPVKEGFVTVDCKVTHHAGHSETASFSIPLDKDHPLSQAHGMASAFSYAERYAFQAAFGIVPGKHGDDDGKAGFTGSEAITKEQAANLRGLAEETDSLNPKFWSFAGVEAFEDIGARDYKRIEEMLLQKKRRMGR